MTMVTASSQLKSKNQNSDVWTHTVRAVPMTMMLVEVQSSLIATPAALGVVRFC